MAEDEFIPDQSYTFDGVNYRAGRPMPAEVAREHGLMGDSDETSDDGSAPADTMGTTIPDDFPKADLLREQGYEVLEDVAAADEETLRDIDGVGPATFEEIRDALNDIGE